MTTVTCLSEHREFLVVADTRYAVHVAAEAIFNAMTTAGLQQRRVFVIEHVGVEGISSDIEEAYVDKDEVGALVVPRTMLPILGFECQSPAEPEFNMN